LFTIGHCGRNRMETPRSVLKRTEGLFGGSSRGQRTDAAGETSVAPSGLAQIKMLIPALKRRDISKRPSGTGAKKSLVTSAPTNEGTGLGEYFWDAMEGVPAGKWGSSIFPRWPI